MKMGMHAWQGISGVWVSTATERTKGKLLVFKDRQKSDKLRFELRKHSLSQRNGKVCRLRN
jgi:hypothetical protein